MLPILHLPATAQNDMACELLVYGSNILAMSMRGVEGRNAIDVFNGEERRDFSGDYSKRQPLRTEPNAYQV